MMLINNYEKQLYTLAEAAQRFNESEELFLLWGASGDITLMVPRPPNAKIGLTNFSGHVAMVAPMRMPDFFKLGGPSIAQLRKGFDANMSRSSMGYQLRIESFTNVSPDDGKEFLNNTTNSSEEAQTSKRYGLRMAEWTIEGHDTDSPVIINRNDIRIHTSELAKISNFVREAIGNDEISLSSTKLNLLNKAAQLFWRRTSVDIEDKGSYPDTEKVVQWFISEKFARSQAEFAASIIVPDGASIRGRPTKDRPIQKITIMSRKKPNTF